MFIFQWFFFLFCSAFLGCLGLHFSASFFFCLFFLFVVSSCFACWVMGWLGKERKREKSPFYFCFCGFFFYCCKGREHAGGGKGRDGGTVILLLLLHPYVWGLEGGYVGHRHRVISFSLSVLYCFALLYLLRVQLACELRVALHVCFHVVL
ncbi:hypothetical protein BZA05DRAFT_215605 [Tricharina praecox]|uniref:uncharacterized protein n=1 Tax=Tricharina praecox TaxID=43433 RepID=UPI00221E55A8|nr:uncharacterized protein BZA05DRAFT_215605 [Tricharina praecox]KAI5855689.1 hypothetical protein BZA05DRAFT_215605 [Tricharina praecox]